MCLLIYKPHDKQIPKSHFINGFKDNPDGGGIAYAFGKELVVDKGFTNIDKMMEVIEECKDLPLMIHFRKASKDMKVSADQCHPFKLTLAKWKVNDKPDVPRHHYAIGHNGRLTHRSTLTESDTACFVQDVFYPLLEDNPNFLDNEVARILLEKHIGMENKMVIFHYDAEKNTIASHILNQDGGWGIDKKAHWLDGVWYSNNSYLPPFQYIPPVNAVNHEPGPVHQLSKTEKDGIDNYRSTWSIPDDKGWYWNFELDCWENKTTGMLRWQLQHRLLIPNYMRKRSFKPVSPLPNKLKLGLSKGDLSEMGKDDYQLSIDEWREKYGIAPEHDTLMLEGGTKDRDYGPSEDREPLDEEDENEKQTDLAHLDKAQRRVLRRAANDYAKEIFGKRKKGDRKYSNPEMITWLRADMRKNFDFMAKFDNVELDKWIVSRLASGMNIIDMIIVAEHKATRIAAMMGQS